MSAAKGVLQKALKYGNILKGLIIAFPRKIVKLIYTDCKRSNKNRIQKEEHEKSNEETSAASKDIPNQNEDVNEGNNEVQAKFQLACQLLKREQNISTKDSLELYGLFKQANFGPCNIPKPNAMNYEAKMKWDHWIRFKDLSQEEAMMLYVEYIIQILPKHTELLSNCKGDESLQEYNENEKELSEKDLFESSSEGEDDEQKQPPAEQQSRGFGLSVSRMKNNLGEDFLEEKQAQQVSEDTTEFFTFLDDEDIEELTKSISQGYNLLSKNHQGSTALHYCIENELINSFNTVVEEFPDINAQDSDGYTPLHVAILNENEDFINLLLEKGADPFVKDNEGQSSYDIADNSIKQIIDSVIKKSLISDE